MSPSAPHVSPISVLGQQMHGGEPFPLVLACETPQVSLDAASAWLTAHRDELCQSAAHCGAVLFRGFPLRTAEDFDRFVAAFELENFPYEDSLSNAVRVIRTPRVFTANEAPASVSIFLHHEMAQTPVSPSKLFFFCEKPAETGGATPLCRSDVLWERLEARCGEFAARLHRKRPAVFQRHALGKRPQLGNGPQLAKHPAPTTRQEAEQRLQGLGYSWQWLDDGCLRATTPVLPAVHALSPRRTSFYNQLIAAYRGWKDTRNDPSKSITFGDGTPLDHAAVNVAIELADELTFDIPWQQGDVALVDNYVTMHGRRTFTGTRKVLASLVAAG